MKNKYISLLAIAIVALFAIPTATKGDGLFAQATITPAAQVASRLTSGMDMELRRRVMFRIQGWQSVWENPKCTPTEVLAALGTDAVKVLTASSVDSTWFTNLATATGKPIADFIDPKYLSAKAGWTVSPHQDGSATATYTAP